MRSISRFIRIILPALLLLVPADLFSQSEHVHFDTKLEINELVEECSAGDTKSCKELAEMAMHDEDKYIRALAAEKINDQNALIYIVKHDDYEYARDVAVRKITDQNFLADVARTDKSYDIRGKAVEKMTDQNLLMSFAVNNEVFPYLRYGAIKNITDQKFLTNFANNTNNAIYLRSAAIMNITDQNFLIQSAKNDTSTEIRQAAVKKITDQRALIDIAMNDKYSPVRLLAVEKVSDQKVLINIAKGDKDKTVSLEAVKKITDQNALADFAKKKDDENIRKEAFKRITDQNILADFAKTHFDESIRRTAFEKLSDQKVLAEIIKTDSYDYSIIAIRDITDQYILADIAQNAKRLEARQRAVKHITDPDILIKIALNDKSYEWVREAALVKIDSFCAKEYRHELIATLNKIKNNSAPNLYALIALSLIPYDSILKGYKLYISLDREENRTNYEFGRTWTTIDYCITVRIKDNFPINFRYEGERGHSVEKASNIGTHMGFIDLADICRYILKYASKEDLIKISNTSDLNCLKDAAKKILK